MNTQQFLFAAVHLLGMLVWKLKFFFVKVEVIDFMIETCTSKDNLMRGSLLPKKVTIRNGKFEAALGFLKRPIFTVYGCT